MPRIRITGSLPQARYGMFMQSSGDPDDDWIRKILEYESTKGSATGGPLSNFGYNDWKKFGHSAPPKDMDEAVKYFKQDFLPKVQQYPAGMRERAADFIYNTGVDPRIYLLDQYIIKKEKGVGLPGRSLYKAQGLNSPKFEEVYSKYQSKIDALPLEERMQLLDDGRDFYYQNINQVNGKPNPSYEATWKGRIGMFPKVQTTTQTTTQPAAQQTSPQTSTTQQPAATQSTNTQPSKSPSSVEIDGVIYLPGDPGYNDAVKAADEMFGNALKPKGSTAPTNQTTGPTTPTQDANTTLNKTETQTNAVTKTPYTAPTGSVATPQGKTIDVQKQPGQINPWMSTNVDINGTPQGMPVNPNAPKAYSINTQGDPTKNLNEEDIVDPRKYLRQQRRKQTWNKVGDALEDVGYGITHPGEMIGKGADFAARKIYQGAHWLNNNKQFQNIANKASGAVTGALTVSPVIQYITDLQNQKRWDKRFTLGNVSDNLYATRPASMSGNRGDWDINTGIFRPDEIGFKSKGQYTNQFNYSAPGTGVVAYGGSINNRPMEKVRIRITGGTEKMATGGQPMTYSGQLGYGLNLGQKRIYTDMPPEKTETINKTIKPVPREQANIEAEKGETVFGDIDGDGAMEHMMIGGKRHSEGGTPLNVPEGSFIFSDTKDLTIKDRKILDKFSMPSSKKGYTPAEIAKKYDTTKYKAIIEDENSDSIKKATAQIMVKTFEKKLAELALVQEQMKGFPQGIPEVAKKFFPELQTKEDQERQPGASENIQFGEQGQPAMEEGAPQGMEQEMQQPPMEEMMGPQMEFGGMIPRFALAGEVGTEGPGDPDATDQTLTPKQKAMLNDPEFQKFQDLMRKYDTGKYGRGSGKYYINSMSAQDAAEFARLASKFGFNRLPEGAVGTGDSPTYNAAGYRIIQGATPGYSFTTGTGKNAKKVGFFGGFTPDLYERRVVEDVYGKEASDKMSDVERRKAYFKEIGVDISGITDAQLSNPKTLYQNRDFFLNKFYPAFTKTFAKEGFRPEMQDDMLIGAEHFDSYRSKPKPVDETVIGFKCTGRDKATGKANIVSNRYTNAAARDADGAVTSDSEAQKQCPPEEPVPGTLDEGCPPGHYRDANGNCVKQPFDYMTPDKVTMLAAALVPPKKYLPWGQKLPFEPGDVVFKDWRAKAAERQSLMNRMANQLNTYSPGAATASNLSFLAGQQAEGLIKDIDDVDAYNVQVANAFSDRERQRKDQNNMLNLAKAEELYKGNVIANQQYDNARRQYFNNMAKSFGNAWKNRMYLGLLNSVNPMFNIDPASGISYFKDGYDENDLFNSTGFTTSSSTTGGTYKDRVADYLRRGYTIDDARKYAAEDDRKGTTASITGKQAKAQAARALLSNYGTLGGGFNIDEEAK